MSHWRTVCAAALVILASGCGQDSAPIPEGEKAVIAQQSALPARDRPFAVVEDGPGMWYFKTTYHPKGKAVFGIPISKLDPTWCEAELLEPGKFPPTVAKQLEAVFVDEEPPVIFHASRMAFTTPQFAAGPYQHLVASSGVYQECSSGKTGIFLIAVNRANEAQPELVFNKSYPDAPIAVLRVFPKGMLEVNWCYSCDDGTSFGWKDGKFQALPSGDDPNSLETGDSACVNASTDLHTKANAKSPTGHRTTDQVEATITQVGERVDELTPRWYGVKLKDERGNEGFLQSSSISIKDPNFGCE